MGCTTSTNSLRTAQASADLPNGNIDDSDTALSTGNFFPDTELPKSTTAKNVNEAVGNVDSPLKSSSSSSSSSTLSFNSNLKTAQKEAYHLSDNLSQNVIGKAAGHVDQLSTVIIGVTTEIAQLPSVAITESIAIVNEQVEGEWSH